jgi:hypothetical protein
MKLSPWEAASCVATHEFPNNLWNPKVHYRVHKIPQLVSVLSQISPYHLILTLRSILILSTHLCRVLPSGLFWHFHHYPVCISLFPIHATCPADLILLDLIILFMVDEEYKLWSRWICSFLQLSAISSVSSPSVLPNTLFSNTLSPLMSEIKFHTHTQPRVKL